MNGYKVVEKKGYLQYLHKSWGSRGEKRKKKEWDSASEMETSDVDFKKSMKRKRERERERADCARADVELFIAWYVWWKK